jgi:hypothetical protein
VIDGNVTGYFECIINTMGCPPLNEKHMLETTGVSEVHKEFKVKWKEFNLDDLKCLQACAKGESASL